MTFSIYAQKDEKEEARKAFCEVMKEYDLYKTRLKAMNAIVTIRNAQSKIELYRNLLMFYNSKFYDCTIKYIILLF